MMNGNPREWAIAFHGVKHPENKCDNGKKVLESIMEGKEKGEMLRVNGPNQIRKNDDCLNKSK